MRTYVVQPGDSPATIAIFEAGCPKCARDLIAANPHKVTITMPNGFVTFKDLRIGETLILPDKWYDGSLDRRAPKYFAALPFADGVTPSTLGAAAAGVLADYAALDVASAKVGALATKGDQQFYAALEDAASSVDASVHEISGSTAPAIYAVPYVQDVRKSTNAARQRGTDLAAVIAAGDQTTGSDVRNAILQDLSNALLSAQLALKAYYGDAETQPATPSAIPPAAAAGGFSTAVVAAAQAAADAINADPSYCTSVAKTGSAVNSAVHAFKTAWNASGHSPVPINTGTYEEATAEAIADAIGGAPLPCDGAALPTHTPAAAPVTAPLATATKAPLSVGAVAGLSLLAAGALGGAVYLKTRPSGRKRSRDHRR